MIGTTLSRSRIVAAALVGTVLALAAIATQVEPTGAVRFLVAPAGLLGLVSPVMGYRLYLMIRERVPAGTDAAAGCNAYLRALVVALGLTEGRP